MAEERRATVAGLETRLIEAGPADAEQAAVFVHGNPGSAADWRDLVARTGEHGRALALDMPGFGRAAKPPDWEYTVPGYAAHLGRALDELGVRRAHLVLHDFGGPWGLAWAAANPDRLASVTLVNSGVFVGYRWHIAARVWRTPLLGETSMVIASRGLFRLTMRRGNPRGLPREFVDRMYDDFDVGTRRAVLRLYRATDMYPDATRALQGALRTIDPPALVVWGAADPYIGQEWAARQRDTFPRARVELLPDSGHFPFADDPERVAELLVPFLAEQLGG